MNPIIAYETAKDALEKAEQALQSSGDVANSKFFEVSTTEPDNKKLLWMEVIE